MSASIRATAASLLDRINESFVRQGLMQQQGGFHGGAMAAFDKLKLQETP